MKYVLCKKYVHLKTLFSIGSMDREMEGMTLLLEIGADCIVYAFLNEQTNSFLLMRYFSVNEFEIEDSLEGLLKDLKNKNPLKIIVSSGLPQALLTPQNSNTNELKSLDLIYGLRNQKYFHDLIPEWQVITLYGIPNSIYQLIVSVFPETEFLHAYTPFVKMSNGISDQQISLHFSTQYFRILTKKEDKLQLAQTYSYKTPLDVIYFIIKICSELQLNQSEVRLIISGLIEEKSALYDELHHYFLHLQFAENSSFVLPDNEYPDYFFASIYNLASCAS